MGFENPIMRLAWAPFDVRVHISKHILSLHAFVHGKEPYNHEDVYAYYVILHTIITQNRI